MYTVVEDADPNTATGDLRLGNGSNERAGTFTIEDTPGQYGNFALSQRVFPSGVQTRTALFTYTLNNDNAAVDALNDGQTLTETFTVNANQVSGPAGNRGDHSATITITIQGETDPPTFGAATIDPQSYTPTTVVNLTLPPATGGQGTVMYAITETLPDGLAFDGDTRIVSGTPTTMLSMTTFTYTVTDSDTPPDITELPFTITITDLMPTFGAITTIRPQRYAPDEPVSVTLPAATGGTDALTYAINPTPPLPDGLTFAPATRVLAGTPTTDQDETTYTYTATDNDATNPDSVELTFTITIGQFGSERALQKTLAAFGRAFAADAVDMISGHLADNGTAATNRFTLGGREIPAQSYAPAEALEKESDRRGNIWQNDNPRINYLSTRALLTKSAFHYNLSDSDSTGSGSGALSIWGRATHGNYEGRPDNFTLDGNLSSAYLGLDFRAGERRQAGVAISYTEGDVDYTDALDDSTGNLDAELTSVLPYMRYTTDGGLGVWGLLGYGTGDARLRTDDGDPIATDIEMRLAAAGVRGTWLSPQHQELAWKAGVFAVEMESEAVASQELPSVNAESQRLRLAIEGRARHEVPGSGEAESAYIAPTWELGLRWDDGDAESGAGADLGLGLQYNNPHSGWNVQARGRYLLVHEEGDYEEWSASMEARKNLGSRDGNGRGLALTLTPGLEPAAEQPARRPGLLRPHQQQVEDRRLAAGGVRRSGISVKTMTRRGMKSG